MIRYIIVDDEHIAHDIIEKYCAMLPNMQLAANCYDAIEAIEFLSRQTVDLIFLDLNMPKLKGFQFLRTLPNPPKVIVTTAYQEYALEGYELNIADYLLKPFSFERFLKAINKAFNSPINQTKAPDSKKVEDTTSRVFLRSNKKYIQVDLKEILYAEASGNSTKVVLKEEVIVIREKLSAVLGLLNVNDFIRVHRSFVVAVKQIKSIEGNQILISDQIIPIGKMYKDHVVKLLGFSK